MSSGISTDTEYLLNLMAERMDGGSVTGDRLYFEQRNIHVRPVVAELDGYLATAHFHVTSPAWDRNVFESASAYGEAALEKIVSEFSTGFFRALGGVESEPVSQVTTSFLRGSHEWLVYASDVMQSNLLNSNPGTTIADESYWRILSNELPKRLGNQKIVYVKIFLSRQMGELVAEVRFNNSMNLMLRDLLWSEADWQQIYEFESRKQFLVFVQKEDTRQVYPYVQNDIRERLYVALELFKEYFDGGKKDDIQEYVAELSRKIDDPLLAEELSVFIPEILAQASTSHPLLVFDDLIKISIRNMEYAIYASQLSSYDMIRGSLLMDIEDIVERFGEDILNHYRNNSETLRTARRMLPDRADKSEKMVVSIGLKFSDTYYIR